ncbi:PorP/SprF family type IX secretion system membrane protein [Mangrovimonas sp. AS39]|uniref:PorP/SprF family type IX secretion system membrane protein n=1 Tax=Mangrovimonas futianensis TaxID=2895523 RepID=UPI001E3D8CBD|nr:PorP/SprF family type IX secretion system membrane protein [Mangrovimonas futianensis]MCF1191876.1 PorP/SprF family type IX secretion system membrane protein [Mangrovimonas futianensis]MCF1195236.1 PorP/SprF family type IX secretion system membrane protein [Mangrovimonas futianensis]
MKTHWVVIMLLILSTLSTFAQEDDGVVSLAFPVRNSLTFNQYTVNPTFSFVRQQYKYISFYNKRQWVSFEDAPLTYLGSYSGRFRENIGLGVGVFQQNYGVLTTFGGVLNFAYNARMSADNNLTFGLNVGAYQSGLNSGKVVSNFPDPSLDNIPSNFLVSVTPGINYGTAFLDFGVALNNLVLYNVNTSEMIKNNPDQSILAHIMYTGYMDTRGFFDQTKFSGIIKSEFREDQTILSGTAMLTVPAGIWGQIGYNTLYGVHGGLGLNITNNILIEYNYEKSMGDYSEFGSSHAITLAYKFENKERYDYSREDRVSALISTDKKRKPATKSNKPRKKPTTAVVTTGAEAKAKADEEAKLAAEALAKAEAEEQARLAAEAQAQAEAEEQARLAAEAQAQAEAEEQARLAAEAQAQAEAEEQARLAAEAQAQAEAEEQARLAAEAQAQAEAEEQARLAAEAQAQAEAEEQARLAAEAQAQAQAEEQARLAAEALAQAQAEAEEQARLAAEAQAQAEAEEQARLAAEAQAQAEAEEQARLAAEAQNEKELTPPAINNQLGDAMEAARKNTEASKKEQDELLNKLREAVAVKDQDLKDLKRENDLSEQGIYQDPKPFKSATEENRKIEGIKADLNRQITARNEEIRRLETLYDQIQETDTIQLDEMVLFYKKEIKKLKSEQMVAVQAKADLESQLETIKIATDYEKKRRIKRAVYNNDEDRYQQDRAALKRIRENTAMSDSELEPEDLDFGEERSSNIQILKNIKGVDNGYYAILAVHDDVAKRDEFLRKVVAYGRDDIDFFFDVNTNKYYIYYQKFDDIQSANKAVSSKGSQPYNNKISLVKIEN